MKLIALTLAFAVSGVAVLLPRVIDDATRVAEVDPKVAIVGFAGDMMFDRTVRAAAELHGYPYLLSEIAPVFADVNLLIANLEGPVTNKPSVSEGSVVGEPSNTRFTFSPEVLLALDDFPIVLNLGNNHLLDFGEEGVTQTLQHAREAEIPVFGDMYHVPQVYRTTIHDETLSFISYNQFAGSRGERAAIRIIADERERGAIPIVYAHWSEEYDPEPTARVRALAHEFVEAGAELVLGSHPHVIGEREEYLGVPIFYSLGNFIFDQYFSQAVRCGLVLVIQFEDGELEKLEEHYVWLESTRQTVPDPGFCRG